MPIQLRDRIIVITGASSGIGAATAVACAEAGMHVVLSARRAERLETVAEQVRRQDRAVSIVAGDVVDADLPERLLAAAEELAGEPYAIFANAGYGADQACLEADAADDRRMFDVNYFAGVDLLRLAARRLRETGRSGHLLMCSSCLSKFSLPRHGTYAATKAAQNAWCAALRIELEEHRIHVSSVHPITTRTEFFDVAAREGGREPAGGAPSHAPELFVQTPERVARAIVRCLRRPCPEVWTSHIVRTVAGAMTAFPRFGDFFVRRQGAKDGGGDASH